MKSFFLIILILLQSPLNPNYEKKIQNSVDVVLEELTGQDADASNEVERLMNLVRENSLYQMNPALLKKKLLEAIIYSLDDEYASIDFYDDALFDSVNGTYSGFGFDLELIGETPRGTYVISNVLDNSNAFRAGLQVGDRIESINGVPVHSSKLLYEGALEIVPGGPHKFRILRAGKPMDFTMNEIEYTEPPITSKIINKDVYYIKINNFSEEMPLHMRSELKKFRDFQFGKLILDLRHNLGGWESSAVEVCAMMCGDEIIAYNKSKRELLELKREGVEQITDVSPIILISKNTASSAELLAACLREKSGAILVGERSFGKNRGQEYFELDGKLIKLTGFLLSPNKDFDPSFQGLNPDHFVEEVYGSPYEDLVLKKALTLFR